jgi:poly(A) polymerase
LKNRALQFLQQTAHYLSEQHQQAYLVGGSLRNILLGEPCGDWDIAVHGDAATLARRLAEALGGYYARMNEKASRVVVPATSEDDNEVILDIAPFKGQSLEDDLRLRDFTVNAIAAPLDAITRYIELGGFGLGAGENKGYQRGALLPLIDPTRGVADILARRLRAVDSDVFQRDPLRLLRAVRLAARYRLAMDSWTEGLIVRDAMLLPHVAPERVHDELYAILTPDGAARQLRFLDTHGLLTALIPEFIPARGMPQPEPHYWDVLEHSIESVESLEQLARLLQAEPETIAQSPWEIAGDCGLRAIQQLLIEAETQGFFQRTMLLAPRMKLAALLHDIGKPATYTTDESDSVHFYGHPQVGAPLAVQIMRRLKASAQDSRLVQQATDHHMRPGQLAQLEKVTPRAIRRYFVDLGPAGIAVALLSLADHLATRGPQPLTESWQRHVGAVCLLLTQYIRHRDCILPPKLVSAEELMHRYNLSPGPLIGRLLDAIAEAQTDGIVHSKSDAFWLVEEILQHSE